MPIPTRAAVGLCAARLAAVFGAEARAQSTGTPGVPPARKRTAEGPVFTPPEKKPPAPNPDDAPPAPPAPPRGEIDLLVDELIRWPSPEARAAAEVLARRWAEAKPAVMALLVRPTPEGRGVAGAAVVLARAGDAGGLPALLATLRDPAHFRWCGEILDAVVALDPLGAKDRLLPLLSVPSTQVVERVARALGPLLVPADVDRLRALFSSKLATTRRAAVGLASETDFAAVRGDLLEVLSDRSAEVALAAASILGNRADAAALEALNGAARGDDPRRCAYAAVALAMAGERRGTVVLEDSTIASLLGSRGLRSADPVLRTAAALALADIGYLRPEPTVDPLLETEIVPALLEVAAGTRFFQDLVLLKPHVVTRLKRLCAGTEPLQSGPDWAAWWEAHRGTFVARRALLSLPAAIHPSLRVRVEGSAAAGAGPCVYGARAEEAPPEGGAGGRFVALSAEEIAALAAAVESSGLLALVEPSLDPGEEPALAVSVEAGNRGRTVRSGQGTELPPAVEDLLRRLSAVRDANRWQRFWNRGRIATFAEFVRAERPFWISAAAPGERERRMADLALGSLRDLDGEEDRLAALRLLAASPAVKEAVGPESALVLASFAAVGDDLSPTGEASLRVLAAAGRTEGLSPLRTRLDAARTDGERALLSDLLQATFEAAPLEGALAAAGDGSSLPTRAAAIRSLGARDGTDQRVLSSVRRATAAEEPAMRAAGYAALARLRAEGALDVLRFAADGEPDPEARAAALEALGGLGGPEVVAVLGKAMTSPEPWVRAAAVRGLAATKEPEGLTFVLTALTSDIDPTVRGEAEKAVRTLGGDRAMEALRTVASDRRRDSDTRVRAVEGLAQLGAEANLAELRALMADPDPEVADAAAFGLSWIRDGEAVPRVLEALRENRSPARALRSIELLSLESFRNIKDRGEAAALYTGWYEVSKGRGPRGWLAEALAARGLGDASLKDFESGANPKAAVPSLLKAFKDAPWYLRRAADLELRRISGRKQADVGPWTTDDEAAAVEEAWNEWWDRERGLRR